MNSILELKMERSNSKWFILFWFGVWGWFNGL